MADDHKDDNTTPTWQYVALTLGVRIIAFLTLLAPMVYGSIQLYINAGRSQAVKQDVQQIRQGVDQHTEGQERLIQGQEKIAKTIEAMPPSKE